MHALEKTCADLATNCYDWEQFVEIYTDSTSSSQVITSHQVTKPKVQTSEFRIEAPCLSDRTNSGSALAGL